VKRLRSVRKEQGVALPIAMAPGATPPEIRIENTDGSWPDFFAWPELQSLVAGQMYGSFATAASYKLILGEQVG
jgi:hypothetical protein